MPINKALEELLATLPEADRGPLKVSLEKYPQLGEGFLRQADYDRKMNDVKTERQKEADAVAANDAKVAKWQKWYDDENPKHIKLNEDFKVLQAEKETLTAQIAAAAAAGEGEVNLSQVNSAVEERLKNFKAPTDADVNRIISEEMKKATDGAKAEFMKETFPAVMGVVMDMSDLQFDHRAEFNEPLPRLDLGKYMQENNISNARQAYDQFIASRRNERALAKAKEEGKEEGKKEILNLNVPGTSGAPLIHDVGHMQARSLEATKAIVPEGATTRTQAQSAAAELRAEGKF